MANTAPLISVIITAYNRREYVRQAVQSVLNQTLSREKYEVILSKNFETEYDKEWEAQGVRLLYFESGVLGLRIADALQHCHGKIIAFLDDDDWWEPEKLKHVEYVWLKHPDTMYYHHSMIFEFDQVIDQTWRRLMMGFKGRWMRTHPWYNSSSAVVAKDVLIAKLEFLKKISLAPDLFYYFAALTVGGRIMFADMKLTHYRVPITPRQGRIYQNDRLVVREMIEESGNKKLLRYYDQAVMCGRTYLNLIERMSYGQRVVTQEFLTYTTRCAMNTPQNAVKWLILAVGLISPRLASKAHRLTSKTQSVEY